MALLARCSGARHWPSLPLLLLGLGHGPLTLVVLSRTVGRHSRAGRGLPPRWRGWHSKGRGLRLRLRGGLAAPDPQLATLMIACTLAATVAQWRLARETRMNLQTWALYGVAAVGLSITPGPNSLLALTHGALHGHRRTLYTVAGGALGFTLLIALSMAGIGALLQASA